MLKRAVAIAALASVALIGACVLLCVESGRRGEPDGWDWPTPESVRAAEARKKREEECRALLSTPGVARQIPDEIAEWCP